MWLETTLAEARRKTSLSKGHFEEYNNGVRIRIEVEDLPWMARLLTSLDTPFVIHQPPELRAVFRQYILTMLNYTERNA